MGVYQILNTGTLTIVGILLLLFILILVIDYLKPHKPEVVVKYKPTPRVKLELIYPSITRDKYLHIPVKSVMHAQETIDVLGLDNAVVGYRRSSDGMTIELYKADDNRTLRRVSEVV